MLNLLASVLLLICVSTVRSDDYPEENVNFSDERGYYDAPVMLTLESPFTQESVIRLTISTSPNVQPLVFKNNNFTNFFLNTDLKQYSLIFRFLHYQLDRHTLFQLK
jgi:hypothetical protein